MQIGATGTRIAVCIAALCHAAAAAPDEGTAPAATAAPEKTAAPTAPETDVRELMNYGVALARQILRDHTGFHPFAFVLDTDGKIGQVALSEGRDHEGTVLLTTLGELLRARAGGGRYRAVAIMADVHIAHDGEETDAIQAGLEHASGYCTNVYFPYERSDEGTLTLAEAISSTRKGTVFGPCDRGPGE